VRQGSQTAQQVWRTLTPEQKQLRLAELRHRQQAELAAEARRLAVLLG
jgi:hypothetical protein